MSEGELSKSLAGPLGFEPRTSGCAVRLCDLSAGLRELIAHSVLILTRLRAPIDRDC